MTFSATVSGSLAGELAAASKLAKEAGALLMDCYAKRPIITWKESEAVASQQAAGGTGAAGVHRTEAPEPVTAADRQVSDFLVRQIRSLYPDDAVVSEEEPDEPSRWRKRRLWIIDPMDGTREFIEHRGEFAVMIGLAVDGVPALGAVYHPVSGKLYSASLGSGAFLTSGSGESKQLRVSEETDPSRMTIALSRSHHHPAVTALQRRLGIRQSIISGSLGLKLSLISEGKAHLYVDLSRRTAQWDTCAPAAILLEAGGRITDLDGMPLRYNCPSLRHVNGVVASSGAIHELVVEAVRRL